MTQMEEKKKPSKLQMYTKMFASTFTLSMFTFGGGFVIVPLMKKKFVDELHWIDEEEMLDMVAIAQSSPGAIAVNGSIIIGYRLLGVPGALVNIVGDRAAAVNYLNDYFLFLRGVPQFADCQRRHARHAGGGRGRHSGRRLEYVKGIGKGKECRQVFPVGRGVHRQRLL